MKNRVLYKVCIFILGMLLFSSCAETPEVLQINPEITQYSPSVSSTPGIGLIAVYSRDLKNSDYKYHWKVEEGSFLQWNKMGSGMIKDLGNDVYTNEHKVYWTVPLDGQIGSEEFYVYLEVVKLDSQEVIDQTKLKIWQEEDGMYMVESD